MGYFNGKKSLNLRLWHWFNFISIMGLVFTYIFRKTWFNKKDNALILQSKLSELGLEISDKNAIEIVTIFRDHMWTWHYIFGFIFIFLLIYRIQAFIFQKEPTPLAKIKDAYTLEQKGAKIAHIVFYIVSIYMVFSGLLLFFMDNLGLSKADLVVVKTLHVYAFWFYIVFIISHISGVIKAELFSDKGLISEMFSSK